MRFALLAALVLLIGCDTQNPGDGEEEEVEEKGPISVAYRVDAPDDIAKFIIRYTDAEGELTRVVVEQPFAFPFVPEALELPAETEGTFEISISGTVPSGQGAVRTTVIVRQDGSRIGEDQDLDAASATDMTVEARSEVTIGTGS